MKIKKIATNSSTNCKRFWKLKKKLCKNCIYTYLYFFNIFFNQWFPPFTIFIVWILTNTTWFITFTLTITRIPNKSFIEYTYPLLHISINSLHAHLHLSSFQHCLLLQLLASNLHLHLHVSCHSMCLASLVLDIKLNTLTFKFLTTSGTHNFAYQLLIFLQLPPH